MVRRRGSRDAILGGAGSIDMAQPSAFPISRKRGFHSFVCGAPVLIVPCASEAACHRRYRGPDKLRQDGTEIDWPVPYWFMDIGATMMVILLAAVNGGLAPGLGGVCDLDALRNLLGVPAEVIPMGVIPIGHPAPDKRSPSLRRGRRPLREVVQHSAWGDEANG